MDELKEELHAAVKLSLYLAKRNYIMAYVVTFISVFASIAAGILVAINQDDAVPVALIAAVASLPAGMMTVNTVFRFEQKSTWFWKKNKLLSQLYRAMVYEGMDPVEVSKSFSTIETELEKEWISFGVVNHREE